MRIRIAVIDRGFISPYWKRLFELLNASEEFEYVVFHGDPPKDTGLQAARGPFSFPNTYVKNIEIPLFGWRPLYQPLVRQVLNGNFDVVIIAHEVKFLSNMMLIPLCKMRGIKVVFWGFGYHAERGINYRAKVNRGLTSIASALKDSLIRLADGYLAYTPRGAKRLAELGYPADRVFVVRQAVDMAEQIRLCSRYENADRDRLRHELGLAPDSTVLLYIGRLVEAKRVDDLVDLTRRLNASGRKVESLIIGDGPELPKIRSLARSVPQVRVLGEIYDQDLIARYLRVVSAVVLPGAGGITVTHAFAHGVPVITRENRMHSPEVDYVEHAHNGLFIPGSYDRFVDAVAEFIDDPALQASLAEGARQSREALSLEHMVSQFHACARRMAGCYKSARPSELVAK